MLNCMGGFHGRNLQDFLQNPWTFARNKASENERHHRQAGGDEAATRSTTPFRKNATKREGAWKGSHFIVKLGLGKLYKYYSTFSTFTAICTELCGSLSIPPPPPQHASAQRARGGA